MPWQRLKRRGATHPALLGGVGEGEDSAREEYLRGAGTDGSHFVRRREDASKCQGGHGRERIHGEAIAIGVD